jgi:hypothetical protein
MNPISSIEPENQAFSGYSRNPNPVAENRRATTTRCDNYKKNGHDSTSMDEPLFSMT